MSRKKIKLMRKYFLTEQDAVSSEKEIYELLDQKQLAKILGGELSLPYAKTYAESTYGNYGKIYRPLPIPQ